jgi:transcriptional regulator with XRE-family HTH domain
VHVKAKVNVQEQKNTEVQYPLEISVPEAIRELRSRLGRTQQQFANDLGLAIRTIAHYESDRIPKPAQMVVFANLAAENNHMDLAAFLNDKVIQSLGMSARVSLKAAQYIREAIQEDMPKLEWTSEDGHQAVQMLKVRLRAAVQILDEANPFRTSILEEDKPE